MAGPPLTFLLCCLSFVSTQEAPALAVEIFAEAGAAPGGNGSRERPFDSIETARDALRAQPGGVLRLLPGTFHVAQEIEFDERDAGVTLRADVAGNTRLIGAWETDAPDWQVLENDDLLARLPGDAARRAVRSIALPAGLALGGPVQRGMGSPVVPVGSEVFLDGVAMTRARWPNTGFARLAEVIDVGSIPRNRADDVPLERRETGPARGGCFRPAGVSPEQLERWQGATNPWAFGYWFHDWADELLPIAEVRAQASEIQLALPHRYGLKQGTTFYITNLIEELDAPGEFFFDLPGQRLLLWPPEHGISGKLVVTTLEQPLLRLRGARAFTLEGLRLESTRGSAIVIEEGEGVLVSNCTIRNTGANGIELNGTRCMVLNCELRGVGATAIHIEGGDRQTLRPGGNVVKQTRIHDFGRVYRTYQPAVYLLGVGHTVQGNEFAHAPHSALIFRGNDHVIRDNEIFDVLRETGDCGAIYCGRDWTMHGTRVERNFIHHLGGSDGRYQNAVYLDDMASGIGVLNNVIWRCNWGMLIGGGRDLEIAGNTFLECALGIRFDARGVGWMAKQIADPATSTLHQRLASMPIGDEPWSSRFPSLSGYLDDRFGRPTGSRVTGNRFFESPFGSVVDRECVHVADNEHLDGLPQWLVPTNYIEGGSRNGELRAGSKELGTSPRWLEGGER